MRQFFRDITYLFRRQDWLRFSVLLLVLLLATVIELASLAAVPAFVAVLTAAAGTLPDLSLPGLTLRWPAELPASARLYWGALIFVALFAIRTGWCYFSTFLQERILKNRCVEISSRLFSAYLQAPWSFYAGRNSSGIVDSVVLESERAINRACGALLEICRLSLVMLAIMVLLLLCAPGVTVGSLLALGGLAGGYMFFRNESLKRMGELEHEGRRGAMRWVSEGVAGYREMQVLGRKGRFAAGFHQSQEKLYAAARWAVVHQQFLWPYLEFVTILVLVGATLISLLMTGGDLNRIAPVMALFVVALTRLKAYVSQLMLNYSVVRYNLVSIHSICRDLRELERLNVAAGGGRQTLAAEDAVPPWRLQRELRLEQVSFAYGDGGFSLREISMTIPAGSAIGLVGATGSGKSTLVDLLLGLQVPTSGRILADGVDIRENTPGWQHNIGYVPQDTFILDASIRENVTFGLTREQTDDDRLREVLGTAQIADFVDSLPEGLDTQLGERGIRLSGGQKQRIAIARALYNQPAVLIFDEATSALDNLTEAALGRAVEALRRQHTLITVAHRLSTISSCDRLYYLEEGRVRAEGNFLELLEQCPPFRAMVEREKKSAEKYFLAKP